MQEKGQLQRQLAEKESHVLTKEQELQQLRVRLERLTSELGKTHNNVSARLLLGCWAACNWRLLWCLPVWCLAAMKDGRQAGGQAGNLAANSLCL